MTTNLDAAREAYEAAKSAMPLWVLGWSAEAETYVPLLEAALDAAAAKQAAAELALRQIAEFYGGDPEYNIEDEWTQAASFALVQDIARDALK
jgi:hypothetical protein